MRQRVIVRQMPIDPAWNQFANFIADMGLRPDGKTLDRINNNGGYFKENCRWATPTEQARNRRTNVSITYNGETHCVAEWGDILGIKPEILRKRLRTGWSLERTFTESPKTNGL
jgi:hypothetical protein